MKVLCYFLAFLCMKPLLSGEITRSYDLNSTKEFVCAGDWKIEIKQTDRNHLTLTAKEPLLNNLVFSHKTKVLSLSQKAPPLPGTIKGVLEVKDLGKIILNGNIAIDIDEWKGKKLAIEINGSSLIEGLLHLEKLSLKINGNSQAILKGTADTQSVSIAGAGTYSGKNLKTKQSTIDIQGVGTAYVNASDTLNATIAGYGHIHYVGAPKVYQKITGAGQVSSDEY
jgi:hypothetical protein